MQKNNIIVKEKDGLNLDFISTFCKESNKYNCKIHIKFKNGVYNAKSILSILSASIKFNDNFELICEGIDEQEALNNLLKFFI